MASPKRRRLEGARGPDTPVLSAFAARQNLWGARAAQSVSQKKFVTSGAGGVEEPSPSPALNLTTENGLSVAPDEQPEDAPDASSHKKRRKAHQQSSGGQALLRLGEGERLVVLGSYGLKVSGEVGEVAILGARLQSSSDCIHWVHAPACHALPVIRATADVAIEIHPHPCAQSFRRLSKLNPVFGKLWEGPASLSAPGEATYHIIFTAEDVPKRVPIQQLVSPAEWNKKLAGLAAAKHKGAMPIVFLCGPKSSGKSTFGKLLLNRFITDQGNVNNKPWSTVAVLDIDPGQPEFTPPGLVSLNKTTCPNLGPTFCHPALEFEKEQLRVHAIASTTPGQNPSHYVEAVLDLFSLYQSTLSSRCPLIINTAGWIQGTGLDILSELIQKLHPSEVIYMSQDGPEETVDDLKSACGSAISFSILPSQTGSGSSRTAADFRTMQTMSYFHLHWPSLSSGLPTWDPAPLFTMRQWRVQYHTSSRGFLGILCYGSQPAPELLDERINGMILALVKIEDQAALSDLLPSPDAPEMELDRLEDEHQQHYTSKQRCGIILTPQGLPLILNPNDRALSPAHSRTLGLVLIQGIDATEGELQLLSPLPEEVLTAAGEDAKSLVLVVGGFDTPEWSYTEDLYLKTADGGVNSGRIATRGTSVEQCGRPYVEVLRGGEKKSAGSKGWRVRRDLGRRS